MEQNRLLLAIVISAAILFGFQLWAPPHPVHPPASQVADQSQTTKNTPAGEVPDARNPLAFPGNHPEAAPIPKNVPRVIIDAPRVSGSISLLGARLDDLLMRDYHETSDPHSPNWPLLLPPSAPQPTYVQYGWSAENAAVKLPDNNTIWTSSGGSLTPDHPVTLSWDNGAGLIFKIAFSIDDHYMLAVSQSVHNATSDTVVLHPWSRVRRDYMPLAAERVFLHEGPTGVMNGRLHEMTYEQVVKPAKPAADGAAFSEQGTGGWAGIADKYMLTAMVPDQANSVTASYRHFLQNGSDRFQVDFLQDTPQTLAPGADANTASHVFAGAMQIRLLDQYGRQLHIPDFDKAIDFGRLYLLVKPFLYALTWLSDLFGNFAVALLTLTVIVKLLFFPLTNYSFRSMQKMSLLGPRMTEMRARFKDDPAKLQAEMGRIMKSEGVNPASGCLPMLVQAPVFIALYNVIYIDIGIWHTPFIGWVRDMSVVDPTNIFNLFGLLPFDPTQISSFLHLGAWPLILGGTMYLQQLTNPRPSDPAQAQMMRLMPLFFMFFFARLPAGLVIYYSWSNTLTFVQQWFLKRSVRLSKSRLAKT